MERKFKAALIISAAVLGLLAGLIVSNVADESYCEEVEKTVKEETELKGAIACFKPGVVSINQTEDVEEGAEHECTCRRSYKGNVQYWTINKANS